MPNRAKVLVMAAFITILVLLVAHYVMAERISNGAVITGVFMVAIFAIIVAVGATEKKRKEERIREKRVLDSGRFSGGE